VDLTFLSGSDLLPQRCYNAGVMTKYSSLHCEDILELSTTICGTNFEKTERDAAVNFVTRKTMDLEFLTSGWNKSCITASDMAS
jgi:hypothetical protein